MQGCIVQIVPILFSRFAPEGQIACFHFLAITWNAEKNILFFFCISLGPYISQELINT